MQQFNPENLTQMLTKTQQGHGLTLSANQDTIELIGGGKVLERFPATSGKLTIESIRNTAELYCSGITFGNCS